MKLDLAFEWDERKSRANLRKHKISFDDAKRIFLGPITIDPDIRQDYGEERWIAIGTIDTRAVVVIFTIVGADRVRLISARKASMAERIRYEKAIEEGQAEDELEGI